MKNAVFPSLNVFSTFVKNQVTIRVSVHFWVFNYIPLIFLPVSIPIPYSFYHYFFVVELVVRDGDSLRSSFTVENTFLYPRFLLFLINLKIALSNSMKN